MRRMQLVLLMIMIAGTLLSACAGDPEPIEIGPQQPVTNTDLQIVTGQSVYVPAYPEVFSVRDEEAVQLTVTLAIHNTDFENPIIIQSISYYDTEGQLVREFIETPIELNPLATTGFVVEARDTSGGWGANFVVTWGAEKAVHEPIIEAVMIGTRNQYGISLISTGRVLSQTFPEDANNTE